MLVTETHGHFGHSLQGLDTPQRLQRQKLPLGIFILANSLSVHGQECLLKRRATDKTGVRWYVLPGVPILISKCEIGPRAANNVCLLSSLGVLDL